MYRPEALLPLLRRTAREAGAAAASFLSYYVVAPVSMLVRELYSRQYEQVLRHEIGPR